MSKRSEAIRALVPGAKFVLRGDSLEWRDPRPKPAEYEILEKMDELVQADRLNVIKARRDKAIASGTVVGGMRIHTDDKSQNRIMGAAVSAMLDPDYTVDWWSADGSVVKLTAPQIIAAASAVRSHVQACFDVAANKAEYLKMGYYYDINSEWPG